ncbi:MAG: hypothetical protein ABEJ65_08090, partial [bacterium]
IKETEVQNETKYLPKYAFSLRYKLVRSDGTVLQQQSRSITWKDSKHYRWRAGGPDRGSFGVTHSLERFHLPNEPVTVTVHAQLSHGDRYDASIEKASIHVHDSIHKEWYGWLWGIVFVGLGAPCLLVALILLLVWGFKQVASRNFSKTEGNSSAG